MKAKRLTFVRIIAVMILIAVFFGGFNFEIKEQKTNLGEQAAVVSEGQKSITLVMVGDLLMHQFVQNSGLASDGRYDYTHLFENVREEIMGADISIINQETLLAGKEFGLSGYPLFNAPSEVADAIAEAGFNVVLQATNHALDRRAKGLICNLEYYAKNHPLLCITGTYVSEKESKQITTVEQNGIKVAILNYTYGTNGIPLPKDMPWAVNLLDESKVRSDIAEARKAADFVVVCPHWGIEYTHAPSKEQRRWCDIFLECGVDLVIGTHPHVIQPVEWYEDEMGRQMLVYFSLGNFVNSSAVWGNGISARMLGGMAKVTLVRDECGEVRIDEATVLPLITHLNSGYRGITTYLFAEYSEELADGNNLLKERDPFFSYQYCQKVFRDVFGSLCK